MTAAQWERVRALFEEVLESPPAHLESWLEQRACGDDEVRMEVRSLLHHHTRAGSFLVRPALGSAPDLLSEDAVLEAGTTLGPYTILGELGRGGMGRVYLASDERLGRRVAIKALAGALTLDPRHRERFRREARAAAGLTHPGICAVHALEEFDGSLFIVTEYIEGETLRAVIETGRRPSPDAAIQAARELASALASAHARQMTHRDLKPENVMRAVDGRLKILDFGLADLGPLGPRMETAGTAAAAPLFGTPAYMAPEQLTGGPVDARSDIFAFGVLMYEYISGVHPFRAATDLATVGRTLEAEQVPLSSRVAAVPAVLAEVVERCLEKDPADRFSSAVDVAAALERAEGHPGRSGATRWWRVHQFVLLGLYVAAVVLAWNVKEWHRGATALWIFLLLGTLAAAAGVIRGHLLFVEWAHRSRIDVERWRTERTRLLLDLAIALGLVAAAVLLSTDRPVAAVLISGLGVGIALAAVLIEPATSAAAFGGRSHRRGRC